MHTVSLHCLTDVVFISCPKTMLPHLDATTEAEIEPYHLSHLARTSGHMAGIAHRALSSGYLRELGRE